MRHEAEAVSRVIVGRTVIRWDSSVCLSRKITLDVHAHMNEMEHQMARPNNQTDR